MNRVDYIPAHKEFTSQRREIDEKPNNNLKKKSFRERCTFMQGGQGKLFS